MRGQWAARINAKAQGRKETTGERAGAAQMRAAAMLWEYASDKYEIE